MLGKKWQQATFGELEAASRVPQGMVFPVILNEHGKIPKFLFTKNLLSYAYDSKHRNIYT